MSGTWEMSNSERDSSAISPSSRSRQGRVQGRVRCCLRRGDSAVKGGGSLDTHQRRLRLIDGRGRTVFEFTEVEVGMYRGRAQRTRGSTSCRPRHRPRRSRTKRSADEMAGEWAMVRAEKPVCSLNLHQDCDQGLRRVPADDPSALRSGHDAAQSECLAAWIAVSWCWRRPMARRGGSRSASRSNGGGCRKAQIRSCCRRNSCKPAQISLKGCRLGSVRQRPGVMPVTRLKARLKAASDS